MPASAVGCRTSLIKVIFSWGLNSRLHGFGHRIVISLSMLLWWWVLYLLLHRLGWWVSLSLRDLLLFKSLNWALQFKFFVHFLCFWLRPLFFCYHILFGFRIFLSLCCLPYLCCLFRFWPSPFHLALLTDRLLRFFMSIRLWLFRWPEVFIEDNEIISLRAKTCQSIMLFQESYQLPWRTIICHVIGLLLFSVKHQFKY